MSEFAFACIVYCGEFAFAHYMNLTLFRSSLPRGGLQPPKPTTLDPPLLVLVIESDTPIITKWQLHGNCYHNCQIARLFYANSNHYTIISKHKVLVKFFCSQIAKILTFFVVLKNARQLATLFVFLAISHLGRLQIEDNGKANIAHVANFCL